MIDRAPEAMVPLHLTALAARAVRLWGLPEQEAILLKCRENAVYRVTLATGEHAALRLHRPGYRSASAIAAELAIAEGLAKAGVLVPRPLAAADGRLLLSVSDGPAECHVSLVTWMAGAPLGLSGQPLNHDGNRLALLFGSLGALLADLHNRTDGLPVDLDRPRWDAAGLVGDRPVWGRFWDCAGLAAAQSAALTALRAELHDRLAALGDMDFGVIHADAVRENVMISGDQVGLIDFDDCGYGYRLFDLATVLLKNLREPHYARIEAALIAGYRRKRALDPHSLAALPLFMLLRSLTYIGWAAARPDMADRLHGYADAALSLAGQFAAR